MHVLMLLSKSFREDPRVYHEAQALRAAGHEVTVVEWARHDPTLPAVDERDGLHLRRIHNRGILRLLPGAVLRNPVWWLKAARLGQRIHADRRIDVVHCHDLDTLPAGVRLRKQTGSRLVYDAHEIFSMMIQGHVPRLVVAAAAWLEARLLPRVDGLVTAGDALAHHYQSRFAGPTAVVWNCFAPAPRAYQPPPAGPFVVTYIGTFSFDRLFPGLVDAIGALDGVRFRLGGKREGLYDDVAARAALYPNVEFLGPVAHKEVQAHTHAGHAVVTMLDPANPQYRIQYANKLFEALASGRPIVVSKGTQLGAFVEGNGVGIACEYHGEAVQAAIRRLQDDPALCERMGKKGVVLAKTTYHWKHQADRLLDLYQKLAR